MVRNLHCKAIFKEVKEGRHGLNAFCRVHPRPSV
jgi:hypothetical protein